MDIVFEQHELRVVSEANELKNKLDALRAFFDTGTYQKLASEEQRALHAQHGHMSSYYNVLCKRIGQFVLKETEMGPTDQEYFAKSFGEKRETSGNAKIAVSVKDNVFTRPPEAEQRDFDLGEPMPESPPEFPPRLLYVTDQEACQQLIDLVHFLNKKWWQNLETGEPIERNTGELLMLVTSELSEALEADRKNLMDDKLPHRPGLEVEIADAIIRLLDMAGGKKLDVAGALVEKLVFNSKREDHTPRTPLVGARQKVLTPSRLSVNNPYR